VYEPRRKPGASQGIAVDAVSSIEISAVLDDDKQVPHRAFRPVWNDKGLIVGFSLPLERQSRENDQVLMFILSFKLRAKS
jgi:hypothetical protein